MRLRRTGSYKLYRQTKTKALNVITAAVFMASLASGSLPLLMHGNALAASSVVTPAALGGWVASSTSDGQVQFVADGTAPLGNGALQLTTGSSTSSVARLTHAFDTALSSVSTLSFQTKQLVATDTANGNITLRINVDTDGNGTMDDQLMFEPYYNGFNGNSMTGWQTWNVATGKLWSNYELHYNGLGGVGAGSYASNFTIADVLHDFPNAKLTGLVISMGTWNVSQQVLADNLILNADVYDFEPAVITPCGTTNAVTFTALSGWNFSETRSTGHNALTADGLHVWTESNTSTDKAAGYYPASFDLANLGEGFGLDATATTGTIPPALQLTVDLDGNGTPEGNLVAEPGFYGANTLWLSSNWTGIDLSSAPATINGGGTGKGGAINAWLTAFPNAKVVAVGYSLGSGVHGDYVITKITAGCTNYTFSLPPPPSAPTNLHYEAPTRACGTATNINFAKPSWDAVPGAVSYDYQALFNGAVVFSTNYPTNQHPGGTFGSGQNGEWAFRVRAVDATGATSDWSTACPITLDTVAPDQPVHLSPANNAAINYNNFWFDWTDVAGAAGYEVQFSQSNSTDGSGALNVGVWPGDASHNQPTESRAWSSGANGTWYWQVRAVDAAGNKSGWTTPWSVTIDMAAPAAPTNLGWQTASGTIVPDNGQTDEYGGTALWDTVGDADHYIYKYWNDITGNPYKVGNEYVTTVGGTSLYGVFNQGEGIHHFCVAAVDAAGNQSACSTPFTITYDTTPPVVQEPGPEDQEEPTETTTTGGNNNQGSQGGHVAGVSTTNNGNPGGSSTGSTNRVAARTASSTGTSSDNQDQAADTTAEPDTTSDQQVLGESTTDNDTTPPVTAKVTQDSDKFLGLGWWWLPILLAAAGFFWWLIAAARRRQDNEEA